MSPLLLIKVIIYKLKLQVVIPVCWIRSALWSVITDMYEMLIITYVCKMPCDDYVH